MRKQEGVDCVPQMGPWTQLYRLSPLHRRAEQGPLGDCRVTVRAVQTAHQMTTVMITAHGLGFLLLKILQQEKGDLSPHQD